MPDQTSLKNKEPKDIPLPQDARISFADNTSVVPPPNSSGTQVAESALDSNESKFPFSLVSESKGARDIAIGNFTNGLGVALADSPFGKGLAKNMIDMTAGVAGDLTFQAGQQMQYAGADFDEDLVTPSSLFKIAAKGGVPGMLFDMGANVPAIAAKNTDIDFAIQEAGLNLRAGADRLIRQGNFEPQYESMRDKFLYDLGSGSASIMTAIGAALLTGGSSAAAYFGLIQKSQTQKEMTQSATLVDIKTGKEKQVKFSDYRDQFEADLEGNYAAGTLSKDGKWTISRAPMNPREANAISTLAGLPEAGLEFVGLHVIMKSMRTVQPFKRALLVAFEQGLQEALQQGSEELLAKFWGRPGTKADIWQRVGYAAFLGVILGVPTGAISTMSLMRSAKGELMNRYQLNEEEADAVINPYRDRVIKMSPSLAEQFIPEVLGKYGIKFQTVGPKGSASFDEWFGDSKVVDENGDPLVVFHGTTHEFTEFKKDRANIENHYGRAYYFTDSESDVDANYAGEGPDLTQRIELRAERVFQEMYEGKEEPSYGTPAYKSAMTRARKKARKELKGNAEGRVMKVYLSLQNPVILTGDNQTRFQLEYDEETGEESGSALELYNAIINTAIGYRQDGQKIWGDVAEKLGDLSDFSAAEFEAALREVDEVSYMDDNETGNLAGNEFIKDVWEYAGFDGIIMDADTAFGNKRKSGKSMTMDHGTKHYIVFEPNKIKSATDNTGAYSSASNDIRFQGFDEESSSQLLGIAAEQWNKMKGLIPDQYHAIFAEVLSKDFHAFAALGEKFILLTKNVKENTVPHEIFHVIYGELLDEDAKKLIAEEVYWNTGITDPIEQEEYLADLFAKNWIGRQDRLSSVGGRIEQFVVDIKTFLKNFLLQTERVNQLFSEINEGALNAISAAKSGVKFQQNLGQMVLKQFGLDPKWANTIERYVNGRLGNGERLRLIDAIGEERFREIADSIGYLRDRLASQNLLNRQIQDAARLAAERGDEDAIRFQEIEDDSFDFGANIQDEKLTPEEREVLDAEVTKIMYEERDNLRKKIGKMRRFSGGFMKEEFAEVPSVYWTTDKSASRPDEMAEDLGYESVDEMIDDIKEFEATEKYAKAGYRQALEVLSRHAKRIKAQEKEYRQYVARVGKAMEKMPTGRDVKKIAEKTAGVAGSEEKVLTEKEALRVRMKAQEEGAKAGFKEGKKVGKAEALTPKPETVKQRVNRVTGVSDAGEEVLTEAQALELKMKSEERAAKYGYKAGYREATDSLLDKESDIQAFKDSIVEYATEFLPREKRGDLITQVRDARTLNDVMNAVDKVNALASEVQRKNMIAKLKKELKKGLDANIAVEYKQRIEDIAEAISFTTPKAETSAKLKALRDWITERRKQGDFNEDYVSSYLYSRMQILDRKPISELSESEIERLIDAVMYTNEMGRQILGARKIVYGLEKDAVKRDIIAAARRKAQSSGMKTSVIGDLKVSDQFMNVLKKLRNGQQLLGEAMLPMDHFFMSFGPGVRELIKKPLDIKYGDFLNQYHEIMERADNLIDELGLKKENFQRIGIYAADQQDGGREKLLNVMKPEDINDIKLTESELKFYNFMREELENVRPEYETMLRDVFNLPLGKVVNYFPFLTDWKAMADMGLEDRFKQLQETGVLKKTVDLSSQKQRIDTTGAQVIQTNALEVFDRHMQDVVYAIHMAKDIKMMQEIARSDDFGEAYGDVGQKITAEWLDLMARRGGAAGQQKFELLDFLRRNAGVSTLALNPSSILMQVIPMIDAAGFIDGWAAKGLTDVATDSEWRNFIMDNSAELRNRAGDDFAFREFSDSWMDRLRKGLMTPQRWLDTAVAGGVFVGAYQDYMSKNGLPVDLAAPNKEGILYAENVVRQSQASSEFKDLPLAITKGIGVGNNKSIAKAFTQFQTPLFYRYGNIMEAIRNPDRRVALLSSIMAANLAEQGLRGVVGAIGGALLYAAFGIKPDEEEEKTLGDYFAQFLKQSAGNVPFVSNALSVAYYKDFPAAAISQVMRVFEEIGYMNKSKRPETKRKWAVIAALHSAGIFAGLPTNALSKMAKATMGSRPQSSGRRGSGRGSARRSRIRMRES